MQEIPTEDKYSENLLRKIDHWGSLSNVLSCSVSLHLCLLVFVFNMFLQLNIHGGRSLQNRSKRFEEVVSQVPGPGAYDVVPASRNMLRTMSVSAGQATKLGKKTVGIWMKLQFFRTSKWAVKPQEIAYDMSPPFTQLTVCCLYLWRIYGVTVLLESKFL